MNKSKDKIELPELELLKPRPDHWTKGYCIVCGINRTDDDNDVDKEEDGMCDKCQRRAAQALQAP